MSARLRRAEVGFARRGAVIPIADGRGWKYAGELNGCPISSEPTPSLSISEPPNRGTKRRRCQSRRSWAIPRTSATGLRCSSLSGLMTERIAWTYPARMSSASTLTTRPSRRAHDRARLQLDLAALDRQLVPRSHGDGSGSHLRCEWVAASLRSRAAEERTAPPERTAGSLGSPGSTITPLSRDFRCPSSSRMRCHGTTHSFIGGSRWNDDNAAAAPRAAFLASPIPAASVGSPYATHVGLTRMRSSTG